MLLDTSGPNYKELWTRVASIWLAKRFDKTRSISVADFRDAAQECDSAIANFVALVKNSPDFSGQPDEEIYAMILEDLKNVGE